MLEVLLLLLHVAVSDALSGSIGCRGFKAVESRPWT
jgi:hypothetical protein